VDLSSVRAHLSGDWETSLLLPVGLGLGSIRGSLGTAGCQGRDQKGRRWLAPWAEPAALLGPEEPQVLQDRLPCSKGASRSCHGTGRDLLCAILTSKGLASHPRLSLAAA